MGNTLTKLIKRRKKNKKSSKQEELEDTTDITQESFRFINGRRYHNAENSEYILPNDDDECDRLHMQHFVFRYAWQSNFASPIEEILKNGDVKILDSGYVSL